MNPTPHLVALVTSDPELKIPAAGGSRPFVVQRHAWSDAIGPLDARMLIDDIASSSPLAMCLGADVPHELALEASRLVDELHPEIGVLMIAEPTSDLWREAARAGVRDVIAPAASATDLVPALQLAFERHDRLRATQTSNESPGPKGKVIVVLSPKGGSGKTMVASNMAIALATTNSGNAVLVDLDCVFGDVASALGLVPEHTIGQLAALPTFDGPTLKVFLSRHELSGLHVLASSGRPEEGEAVTEKVAGTIIDMLARDFTYVVIDTAAGLDERALAAIEHSTDVVLVASMDVTSIRNLAKAIDTLDRLDMVGATRHFILNRADTRVGLEVNDVESAIGMKVEIALPSSRMVPLCMNRGIPVVLEQPDSPVAKELVAFASRFTASSIPIPSQPAARKRRFPGWRN